MNSSVHSWQRFPYVFLSLASPLLAVASAIAGPPQPPIVTSGEFVLGDFDNDSLIDEASIDWITFDVTDRTSVNFDALIIESIFTGSDLNGDGEITRADGGMVLFDQNQNVLVLHDDAPGIYGDDGSISYFDGNFDYTFETAGTYTLAIAPNGFFLTPEDALAGFIDYRISGPAFRDANGDDADHADWQLTLTVDHGAVSNVRVNTLGMPATPNPVEAVACTYLWPPDSQLVGVGLFSQPDTQLLVYCNEADATANDVAVDIDGSLQLSAERAGDGTGRIYLVLLVTDNGNNEVIDCCAVVVPHDKSQAAMDQIEYEAAIAQMECLDNHEPPSSFFQLSP